MQGIVTADDIADVIEQEASEESKKSAAWKPWRPLPPDTVLADGKEARGLAHYSVRGRNAHGNRDGNFEKEIERAVVLALFVPLIISSGGNSGSQATTLVIRAMALGELRLRDWWRVVSRELATGFVLGSVLGIIGMTRIVVWQALWKTYGEHYISVALTVAFSLIGVVLFGTIAGSMLPFVLRRMGLDPASASAPSSQLWSM